MKQNVLICPLYWGTGHATRMAALALKMMEKDFRIIVAAPGPLLSIYNNLPVEITVIKFRSYEPRYPLWINLSISLLFQLPVMLFQYFADILRTGAIIRKYEIDIILSDNRFGCYSKKIHSVYITHQLNIMSPFRKGSVSRFLSFIHRHIIKRYDECWIPDMPGEQNLSGQLSHPARPGIPFRYIGILSHLAVAIPSKPEELPDGPFHLLILSGPEPMKSHFEKAVISIYSGRYEKLVIAGSGLTGSEPSITGDLNNITRYGYIDPSKVKYLMEECERIICRPGYSTVMDLISAGKRALLVPTPGQPEQEYLASYLSEGGLFSYQLQKDLDYKSIEMSAGKLAVYHLAEDSGKLALEALDDLPK